MTLRERIRELAYSSRFEGFILAVIVVNALIIGAETYSEAAILRVLDKICVAIFVAEIALKFIGRRSAREYFTSGWNWFDIIVVAAALVPGAGSTTTTLRILRVFRVLRLVRFIPELAVIAGVLVKSLKSMVYIGLLMGIITYLYAIVGVELFGGHMAEYATLHETFFTLFRSLTAEDWTDLRYDGLAFGNYWVVTLYHVSWIVVATFVMLNLVVGAILNNYNLVQEAEAKRHRAATRAAIKGDDERLEELLAEMREILDHRRVLADRLMDG